MKFYPIVFFLGILSMLISITAASWKGLQATQLAVIVHKNNVLDKITATDARNYYLSMADKKWPVTQLPVVAVQKAGNSLEKEKFCARVLHMHPDDVNKYFNHQQQTSVFNTDTQIADFVASQPGAIGYVNVQSLSPQARAKVKVLLVITE